MAFIKRDFDTRRIQMNDIQREAGFSHVSVKTLLRALKERKIGAYHEEFKPILIAENKKIRLVRIDPTSKANKGNKYTNG